MGDERRREREAEKAKEKEEEEKRERKRASHKRESPLGRKNTEKRGEGQVSEPSHHTDHPKAAKTGAGQSQSKGQ